MVNGYLDRVIERATWKKVVIFTILFMTFYAIIWFSPIGMAGLQSIAGHTNILDLEAGFTYETAYSLLTELGEDGRTFHLTRILPLDFPFPFSFMLLQSTFIALLLKHMMSPKPFRYLLFMPILAMIFDYIENAGVFVMLTNYPNLPKWAVLLGSVSGILKRIFGQGSLIVIGLLFITYLYLRIFRKRKIPSI